MNVNSTWLHFTLAQSISFKLSLRATLTTSPRLILRTLLTVEGEAKHSVQEIKIMQIDCDGRFSLLPDDWDLARLGSGQYLPQRLPSKFDDLPWEKWRQVYDSNIGAILTQTRLKVENPLSARVQLQGISLVLE